MSRISDILSVMSLKKEHFCSAVIVAAGSGKRCDCGDKTKQMTELLGIPVIVRTVIQFEQCPFINEIIIVAKENELPRYNDLISEFSWTKIKAVVKGGDTRQKSVFNGICEVSEEADYIAVHDGCRCLVTPEMIENVLKQAWMTGCDAAACKAKDTIKLEKNGMISETIDRKILWMAQTPQIFKSEILRAGAYITRDEGVEVTDDCMMAEYLGFKIKLVDCGYENIKITTPEDLYIAEAILKYRSEQFDRMKAAALKEAVR